MNTDIALSTAIVSAETMDQAPTPIVRPRGFQPGTPKPEGSGRKPGTPNKVEAATATAMRMGFNPIEAMITLIQTGAFTMADGRVLVVDPSEIAKMLREVAPYIVSKAPTAVVAKHDHRHIHADLSWIMLNPAAAEAAETLALAMSQQTNESPVIEGDFEDV